jgi:electron transfer flavoprotein alpha subunit
MRPGVPEARKTDNPPPLEVRVIDVDLSAVPELTTVERFLPADPRTVDLVFAQRIVSAGRGTGGPEGVRLVTELADALGASLGASRMVVDLGWAPAERQVGQTGRTVHPDLYVACGISGASHHLAGMRESKHIVAINPDAGAPIHEVAHLSLQGDLHQVIPAIRAALQRRSSQTS